MSEDKAISQTGMCHCQAVKFKVEGQIAFSGYCHCKNCVRNRGIGPVHLIAVTPKTSITITEGKELLTSYGEDVARVFCRQCGCVVYQDPQGKPFVALLPVTFHLEGPEGANNGGCLLPEKYRPTIHINYESRLLDYNDALPKFKGFPQEKCPVDNRGVEAGAEYVPVKEEEADAKICQTGTCHCEAVKFSVEGDIMFSIFCHCKNCVRNRGVSPSTGIGVTPETGSLKITQGEDLTTNYGDESCGRVFCNVCGCIVYACPKGHGFVEVFPATFHLENPNAPNNGTCLIPNKLRPTLHINYESRLRDWNDDLPKFKGFHFEGYPLQSDGTAAKTAAASASSGHSEEKVIDYCDVLTCYREAAPGAKFCQVHTVTHTFSLEVPASNYWLSIREVREGKDAVHVLAQCGSRGGGASVITTLSDSAIGGCVDTHKPVKYYLVGKTWNWDSVELGSKQPVIELKSAAHAPEDFHKGRCVFSASAPTPAADAPAATIASGGKSYIVVLKKKAEGGSGDPGAPARLATQYGFNIERDLPIINGFSTRLSAEQLAGLEKEPDLKYAERDA